MGAGFCSNSRCRTSLNIAVGREYLPRMGVDGEEENLNDFNADEY
jgi:hypothetical protein